MVLFKQNMTDNNFKLTETSIKKKKKKTLVQSDF